MRLRLLRPQLHGGRHGAAEEACGAAGRAADQTAPETEDATAEVQEAGEAAGALPSHGGDLQKWEQLGAGTELRPPAQRTPQHNERHSHHRGFVRLCVKVTKDTPHHESIKYMLTI